MAKKTNCTKNGKDYCRITRTVGKRLNRDGIWVSNKKEFYGSTQKEAIHKYEAFIKMQNDGLDFDRLYFGEMADFFVYQVFLNDSRYAESTKEMYIRAYEKYMRHNPFAGLPLKSIQGAMLQQFYNGLNCSPSGLKKLHKVLTLCFRYFSREGYCRNITENLTLPKKKGYQSKGRKRGEVTVWTDHELSLIIDNLGDHRLRFLILLAANTGCRISELLALEYSDIQQNIVKINKQVALVPIREKGKVVDHELIITEPKTVHSHRAIPLSSDMVAEFKRHQKWHEEEMTANGYDTQQIFTTQNGNLYDRHNINRACQRYYRKIGVEAKGIHTYRHTFATKLCEKGVPIQVVSALLGHSSINVTAEYYVNISNEEKQKAINALALL